MYEVLSQTDSIRWSYVISRPYDLFFQLAKRHEGKLFGLTADTVKHVKAFLASNFSEYFENTTRSCINVHTIFDRSAPLDLRRIYIPLHLEYRRAKLTDAKFRSSVTDLPDHDSIRTFLVIGSAGTAKTMLLKHMFLTMIENSAAKMPFYIPLRKYNSEPAALPGISTQNDN